MDIGTADAATNTDPLTKIGILNLDKTKKKPYDVRIKNYNPNEPKARNSKVLYSDKQKYRKYKTKTEPKLYSKIMVDDEEDLIAKIRKEFGIEDKTRKNYSEVETSGTPYYEAPNPQIPKVSFNDELSDMTRNEIQDILNEVIGQVELAFGEEFGDVEDEDLLAFDDDEPAPLVREASRGTVLSALTTKAEEIERLTLDELLVELDKRGMPRLPGRPPKSDESVKRQEEYLRNLIMKNDKERGAIP